MKSKISVFTGLKNAKYGEIRHFQIINIEI